MSIQIAPYPTLTDDLRKRIGFSSHEYSLFYTEKEKKIELNIEVDEHIGHSSVSSLHVSDDEYQWHPETHDLHISRVVNIRNPVFLFGSNGIVSKDSQIGIALVWHSKDSKQRGVFCQDHFSYRRECVEITLNGTVKRGKLKGIIHLQTVLFLKKCGAVSDLPYTKREGSLLGILDENRLVLDGRGSSFPIVEVEEQGQPLWYVKSSWINPLEDQFIEENVVVCINRSHPHYIHLNMQDSLKNSPFLAEIIASAMQTIVQKVMQSDEWEVHNTR